MNRAAYNKAKDLVSRKGKEFAISVAEQILEEIQPGTRANDKEFWEEVLFIINQF